MNQRMLSGIAWLLASLMAPWGCAPEDPDTRPLDPRVAYVVEAADGFDLAPSDGIELELVAGFQGGFHIEPTLRLGSIPAANFPVTVEQRVIDPETGVEETQVVIHDDADSLRDVDGHGYIKPKSRLIFQNGWSYCDLMGKVFEIRADVTATGAGPIGSASIDARIIGVRDERPTAEEQCPAWFMDQIYSQAACTTDADCNEWISYAVCYQDTCDHPATIAARSTDMTGEVTFERNGNELLRLHVERAASEPTRSIGLAQRPCMAPEWAMLFVHDDEEVLEHDAEQMCFAMDLVFANADGAVVAIHRDILPKTAELHASGEPASYAVEMRAGTVDANDIRPGDRLVID